MIIVFSATDEDVGNNGKVGFRFENSSSNSDRSFFHLSEDGSLSLRRHLDAETQDTLTVIFGGK